ncbi:hypothetical protein L2E82_45014 [Cichorium intybus]|uniref:Uncharacterized protein n=1 Tax=Cichorium intybus TaxID=13427 RepID=A0ACB8ZS14_CICIN|nr:hypothetical protein L2E82_45014 [Cichorium intybus]
MKNIVKSRKEDANASSSFTRLPDEIILQVLNKLIDSKTLICCYLVSKRFSSIVVQVDAISFPAPFLHRRIPDKNTVSNYTPSRQLPPELSSFYYEFFGSAIRFLRKFKGVKSLCVAIPSFRRRGRLFLSGEKLREVKEWVHSASETVMGNVEIPKITSYCYIPDLKLPVSGYVMKGLYVIVMEIKGFQGGNDVVMNSNDGFEDEEEAAYTEAVMEILEKHKDRMQWVF